MRHQDVSHETSLVYVKAENLAWQTFNFGADFNDGIKRR